MASGARRSQSSHLLPYTIPNCVALQIISDVEAPLSEGDLTLRLPTVTHPRSEQQQPSSSTESGSTKMDSTTRTTSNTSNTSNTSSSSTGITAQPILLCFVGKTIFPLYKDTVFGTFAKLPRQYGFDFILSKDTSTQVRLVLPDSIEEEVQDQFEQILIDRGLLLQGFRAAADEIARGAREGAHINAARIRQGAQEHIRTTPAASGSDARTYDRSIHEKATSVNDASTTFYRYATQASSALTSAAGTAGAGIAKGISNLSETMPASMQQQKTSLQERQSHSQKDSTDMSEMRKALAEAASGVGEGTTQVAGAAQDSASAAIHHSYGEETKDLATSAGDSVKQMGKAVGGALHSTSVIGASANAVEGATREEGKQGRSDQAA